MKLEDINNESEILSEGLVQLLGKLLKNIVLFIGAAYLAKLAKKIIFDEKKLGKSGYYIIVGDMVQVERDKVRMFNDLIDALATELQLSTLADKAKAVIEKVPSSKIKQIENKTGKQISKSGGDIYNINISLIYSEPRLAQNMDRQLDRINEKYGSNFKVLKYGRL